MTLFRLALAGLSLSALLIRTALADEGRGHRDHHTEAWHGEIHRFHEHDLALWRSGAWRHARHDGRLGWWWVVGGVWYFYPAPVYPYPDPYQPPIAVVPPAVAAAPQYWYYCSNPAGYYPYVAQCATVWQRVPANPPPGPPATMQPPPR